MSPIRLGFVGLSTSSIGANWAAIAHLPYLQSEQGKKHYEIVALCNSSVASAEKAIEHFKLPSSTKAYGSAADMANDTDVDLFVNVTGVDRHYEILLPAAKVGKSIYTELPLASNMDQMKELMQVAGSKNIKNAFGMQGQNSPVTKLIRDVIAQGKIGKVLSSTWIGFAGFLGDGPMPIGLRMWTEREVGGNLMTCGPTTATTGQRREVLSTYTEGRTAINFIVVTLGELKTFHSILGNQRPSIELVDPKQAGKTVETVQKDTPDQIMVQGRFESGAILSYHLRGGDSFPGEKNLSWLIYGEKGELKITNKNALMDIMHDGVTIQLHQFGKDVEDLQLPKDDLSELPHPAQNVGRIYDAYANGIESGEGAYPTWNMGMKIHELIEDMWARSEKYNAFGDPVGTA